MYLWVLTRNNNVPSPLRGGRLEPALSLTQGWGGVTTARARELRKNPTQAESVLWKHLRYRQLDGHKFRRQVSIGPYIADFVSLENRLIIEVDGGHHPDQEIYDAERTIWLQSQGFRVLRFWNNQVLQDIEGVKEAILKALEVSR